MRNNKSEAQIRLLMVEDENEKTHFVAAFFLIRDRFYGHAKMRKKKVIETCSI